MPKKANCNFLSRGFIDPWLLMKGVSSSCCRLSIKRSHSVGNINKENAKTVMLAETAHANDTYLSKPILQHGLMRHVTTTSEGHMKQEFVEVYEDCAESRYGYVQVYCVVYC